MSTHVDYEYEIVLKVVHHELSNPDMPSLNPRTFAEAVAAKGNALTNGDITLTVKSVRLLGVSK